MKPRSKSRVDRARRLRRRRAAGHGPGAALLRPCRVEGFEPEQTVRRADHAVQARLRKAEAREKLGALGFGQLRELGLERGRDHDELGALPLGERADGRHERVSCGASSATFAMYITGFAVIRCKSLELGRLALVEHHAARGLAALERRPGASGARRGARPPPSRWSSRRARRAGTSSAPSRGRPA